MTPPNDWEIRKCLIACLSFLIVVLGLIGLDSIGFGIPGLQQITGLLFLAFVPGVLLLRILKIHNVSIIESLLYTVGLGIAFVMSIGVILDFALPPLGVSHPITVFPIITAITVALLILGFVAYKRDRTFTPASPRPERTEARAKSGFGAKLAPFLLAVLLPLLAILGAILVNSYQDNTLLLVLIFVIAVIIGLVAFDKFIPSEAYPLLIVLIAISLLYQTTLISNYLVGSDIHLEYYYAKLVSEGGYWNASIANPINSCLSIVMLAPVYSLLLNMDIVWLFKIIYPLFFCLVPLTLFRVFRIQIGPRYAFLAAVFFIAMPMFFMDMTQLARQQISELFFVLVIFLMVDRKFTTVQRTILVIVFGLGVIVSYYGLGTGYAIGYITFGLLVLMLIKSRPGRAAWQWLIGKSNSLPPDLASAGAFNRKTLAIIISVSLVFMFAYYGAVASGAALSGFRVATDVAQGTIQVEPLAKEPLVQTALGLDFLVASPGGKVWRVLQYLVELFLIVGFLRLIFRPAKLGKLKAEYIALVIVSALILLGVFVLPTWSYGMGITRIWQITLLLLAPLFIFGGETVAVGIMKLFRACGKGLASLKGELDCRTFIWFPAVVILIPYFFFNTGVIFELSQSQTTYFINMPYSIALSSHRLDLNTVFTRQDLNAASWLCKSAEGDEPVYVDHHSSKLFLNRIDFPCHTTEVSYSPKEIDAPGYFYLRAWNIENRALTFGSGYASRQSVSFDDLSWFRQIMQTSGRIYNDGGAQILMLNEGYP